MTEKIIPDGYKLVAVKGLDELAYWLDRCKDKGHLENCADLIEPFEAFEYRNVSEEAVIASHEAKAAPAVPGWKWAPIKPTKEMVLGALQAKNINWISGENLPQQIYAAMLTAAPSQEPVTLTDELLEALRECVDSLWVIDSHVVDFDGSVRFGPYYDFSGLDGIDRHEFLAEHSCVVWPSGGKWSAYCTYDGATWFELFDSADAAKEKCMELLDRVMPTHPAMKARAIIAALREKEGGV